MKIAFISSILGYPWGGPDRLWTEAAHAALRRGDEVLLCLGAQTANHDQVRDLQALGAELFVRSANSVYRGRLGAIKRRSPFGRLRHAEPRLAAFGPDSVFITQGGVYDFLAEHHLYEWLFESGTPYSVVCHQAADAPPLDAAAREAGIGVFSKAAIVLFVSSANLAMAEHQLRFRIPRASVMQNPLALQLEASLSWPDSNAAPILFSVGRMDLWQKGWDLFFEAAAQVSQQHDFVIRLAGRGPDASLVREYADFYGLGQRVDIREFLPDGELESFWQQGELFLLPSRAEGCASTMLEAMMCGRPQLVTPVGGVSDWLSDGEDAFIADGVSANALASCLERALSQRSRWAAMGRVARTHFDTRRVQDPASLVIRTLDQIAAARLTAGREPICPR